LPLDHELPEAFFYSVAVVMKLGIPSLLYEKQSATVHDAQAIRQPGLIYRLESASPFKTYARWSCNDIQKTVG
jgi:hypothetical protein